MSPSPQPFNTAKRRVHRKRRDMTSTPVAALEVTAVIDISTAPGGELDLTVVFNTTADDPLIGIDAADPFQWTTRYGGGLYYGNSLEQIAYNQVRLISYSAGVEAGADVINYACDPGDIFDATGRALAALEGFPI